MFFFFFQFYILSTCILLRHMFVYAFFPFFSSLFFFLTRKVLVFKDILGMSTHFWRQYLCDTLWYCFPACRLKFSKLLFGWQGKTSDVEKEEESASHPQQPASTQQQDKAGLPATTQSPVLGHRGDTAEVAQQQTQSEQDQHRQKQEMAASSSQQSPPVQHPPPAQASPPQQQVVDQQAAHQPSQQQAQVQQPQQSQPQSQSSLQQPSQQQQSQQTTSSVASSAPPQQDVQQQQSQQQPSQGTAPLSHQASQDQPSTSQQPAVQSQTQPRSQAQETQPQGATSEQQPQQQTSKPKGKSGKGKSVKESRPPKLSWERVENGIVHCSLINRGNTIEFQFSIADDEPVDVAHNMVCPLSFSFVFFFFFFQRNVQALQSICSWSCLLWLSSKAVIKSFEVQPLLLRACMELLLFIGKCMSGLWSSGPFL